MLTFKLIQVQFIYFFVIDKWKHNEFLGKGIITGTSLHLGKLNFTIEKL